MAAAEVLGTKALFPEVNDLNINFVAGPAELNINPVDEDETVTPSLRHRAWETHCFMNL